MNTDQKYLLSRMNVRELNAFRAQLAGEILQLTRLAKELETEMGKSMLARQREHLKAHQESYYNIDVTGYPNVVVAKLAGMIGIEREIRDNISFYEDPLKRKKELDEQLSICDDVLKAKESEELTKRR